MAAQEFSGASPRTTGRADNAPDHPRLTAIHTAVAGRARFNVCGLYRNAPLKTRLEQWAAAAPVVNSLRASVLTGNIIVEFDPALGVGDIAAFIEQGIEQGIGSGAMPANTPTSDRIASFKQYQDARRQRSREITVTQRPWHAMTHVEVAEVLRTSLEEGLSHAAAAERLISYGLNRLPEAAARSQLEMVAGQFASLPVGMLLGSAVVSVLTGGVVDAAVIVGVVVINAAIGFGTERQAERTIQALTRFTPRMCRVVREGRERVVPLSKVVPGDIVALTPGSHVPADLRLFKANRLSVDESALTGESLPVRKDAAWVAAIDTALGDRGNMAYLGTMVTGGSGSGVVVGIADDTELGRIQAMVGAARAPQTPMERQLAALAGQLAVLSGAVCVGVFAFGLLRGYGLMTMLRGAISLAVAAVPEGLPAVATTTLALGIRNMRRHQVAVRHLDAVETLGSVQVICLDKTGTLTVNRMTVVAVYVGLAEMTLREGRFYRDGQNVAAVSGTTLRKLLEIAALCNESQGHESQRNESQLNDGDRSGFHGSPTEMALVQAALDAGVDVSALRDACPRLKVRYRAEERPYMRTVHRQADGAYLVAMKGSPPALLAMCRYYAVEGEIRELDDAIRNRLQQQNERMAGDALRVLAVAYRTMTDVADDAEADLIWLGLVGMADPLRPGMAELIAQFHRAGIKTVMITGDQSATAYSIGRQLNLSAGEPLQILDSSRLDKVPPALLAGVVKNVHVFARVSPAHKLQIVQALQQAGQVVAMTGDGINDGPALKAADIGVAMGSSGADVARSVADVVLENDNLNTMVDAISQGRTIYSNIRKTLHFLLATNFTEIEVMLAGMTLGLGQPLNPMQLLWINLISDIFPGLALSMEPAESDVLTCPPRASGETVIDRRRLLRMVMESGVITAGAMASYGYAVARYGVGSRAGTHAFTTLTLAQLLHGISCRSERHGLFNPGQRPPNPALKWALAGSFAVQGIAAFTPGIRGILGVTPVSPVDSLVIGAAAALPLLVNESTKLVNLDNIHEEGR